MTSIDCTIIIYCHMKNDGLAIEKTTFVNRKPDRKGTLNKMRHGGK